jgi:hypothetical protein
MTVIARYYASYYSYYSKFGLVKISNSCNSKWSELLEQLLRPVRGSLSAALLLPASYRTAETPTLLEFFYGYRNV